MGEAADGMVPLQIQLSVRGMFSPREYQADLAYR